MLNRGASESGHKGKELIKKVIKCINSKSEDQNTDSYMDFHVIVAVTFCASGTNILGAIFEGATGDYTILLSKAVMDIFASMIFAMVLGYAITLIVVPQFLSLSLLFYLGHIYHSYNERQHIK